MATMTRAEAVEFLTTGTLTGHLATASPGGYPHVAPVWFVVDGGDLVFTTGFDTTKGRHLRANPRASLNVDVQEFPYDFAVVHGPVVVDEHPNRDPDNFIAWTTRLAQRYVPAGQAQEYGISNAVPSEMLCRLTMQRITGERAIAI
jgi:PPOX class probable F420-dependent enzyme